jgi:aryl-alcohol dehydrogenase-like predicted oxidoreductase
MAQEPWIVPILGTLKMPHLFDNIGADSLPFTPEERGKVNAALVRRPVHGA